MNIHKRLLTGAAPASLARRTLTAVAGPAITAIAGTVPRPTGEAPSTFQMIVAVDPGTNGGIAWRNISGAFACATMPTSRGGTIQLVRDLVAHSTTHTGQPPLVFVEKITGYIPAAGAGFMFKFGQQTERVLCAFECLGAAPVEIRPQVWQSALGLSKPPPIRAARGETADLRRERIRCNSKQQRDWKAHLQAEATRRFPTLAPTLKTADALLILAAVIAADTKATTP